MCSFIESDINFKEELGLTCTVKEESDLIYTVKKESNVTSCLWLDSLPLFASSKGKQPKPNSQISLLNERVYFMF